MPNERPRYVQTAPMGAADALRARQVVLEGIDRHGETFRRFHPARDNGVHGLEGIRGKEHLAALGTHLCGHVPHDVEAAFPAVDVFDASRFNKAFAEQALLHCGMAALRLIESTVAPSVGACSQYSR